MQLEISKKVFDEATHFCTLTNQWCIISNINACVGIASVYTYNEMYNCWYWSAISYTYFKNKKYFIELPKGSYLQTFERPPWPGFYKGYQSVADFIHDKITEQPYHKVLHIKHLSGRDDVLIFKKISKDVTKKELIIDLHTKHFIVNLVD